MSVLVKIESKISHLAKQSAREIAFMLGTGKQFFRNARGSRMLIYHGICQQDHTRFSPIFLTQKTFEQQLKLYKKYFNVVSLSDYYEGRFSEDRFNVCLTFDDGYANNLKYVLPLLEKYQVPATFFITAIRDTGNDILWNDFLWILSKYGPDTLSFNGEQYTKGRHDKYADSSGLTLNDHLRNTGFDEKAQMMKELYPLVPFREKKEDEDFWQQLTVEDIKTMSVSPWVTIGAHSCYHNDLAKIPPADAVPELTRSKKFLENITGHEVNSFAFPYGSYTPDVVAAAKAAGYTRLLAMDFYNADDNRDPALRERLTVNPFISPVNQMYATINRRYD